MIQDFLMEMAVGLPRLAFRLVFPVERKNKTGPGWWQRPGLGIMYQIEARPGWQWNRDFVEFNREMMNPDGSLNFNGPFCKIDEWMELSRAAGANYHIMEIKWHDGICYFNTSSTKWKTPVDYADLFAKGSRKAGIPFMYYYSAIFDHNPQLDPIQPVRNATPSYLAEHPQPVYEEYLRTHYREICEQYEPDGMWIDWWWPDYSTKTTLEFFRANFPRVVLTFNLSNYFTRSYRKLDYTSGEAHDLNGPLIKLLRIQGITVPLFSSAWRWASLGRRTMNNYSELISPTGRMWDDWTMRDDPHDLLRMAAIVMASGGRFCTGVAAQLDGTIYPDLQRQLRLLGQWYIPRQDLFSHSTPLRYRGQEPDFVRVHPKGFKKIACQNRGDVLLHLINMDGATRPIELKLQGKKWAAVSRITLEPSGKELQIKRDRSMASVTIKDDIDPVDVILRMEYKQSSSQ